MASSDESILNRVRQSCEYACAQARHVSVDDGQVAAFADTLARDLDKIKSYSRGFNWPLKMSSDEYIDFLCILDLLNFGSGFRHDCHRLCGRGVFETVQFGLMGMVLSNNQLDADFMVRITLEEVSSYFNLPLEEERPHETLTAVYRREHSSVRPFAENILRVLHDSGRVLQGLQCKDFRAFLHQTLSRVEPPTCHALIEALRKYFMAFNDVSMLRDKTPVFLLKKAQLLCYDLHLAFKDNPQYPWLHFADIDQLTVFVDNVLPAVLRKEQVLRLDADLQKRITDREVLSSGPLECELRVCAVVACERIVDKIGRAKFNSAELDYYLWTVGKHEEYRSIERHACKDTIFY